MVDEPHVQIWSLQLRHGYTRVEPAVVAPVLGAPSEEPGISGFAEKSAPSPSYETIADIIVDRHKVPSRRRGCDHSPDFGR